MKLLKLGLFVIGGLFLFIGIGALVMFISLRNNMKEINAMDPITPDLTLVEDGVYVGSSYYKDQIGATVEVHVSNHQITEILFLDHKCGKGSIAEVIVDDVILEQSLDVDCIAGATSSSTLILLAIQDALGGNE